MRFTKSKFRVQVRRTEKKYVKQESMGKFLIALLEVALSRAGEAEEELLSGAEKEKNRRLLSGP
jgi:hypothetical protein